MRKKIYRDSNVILEEGEFQRLQCDTRGRRVTETAV